MKSLMNFLQEKLGNNINIEKYEGQDILTNQELIYIEDQKYIITLDDNKFYEGMKGFCYLLEIQEYKYEDLKLILENLFLDCKIFKAYNYILISFKNKQDINEKLSDIIESEIYSSTKIIYLGEIKHKEDFLEKIKIARNILSHSNKEKTNKKYFHIRNYIGYKIIKDIFEYKYLEYIFTDGSIELLDINTIETGILFIENNLNISKTASKMYLHRNTLLYRLEKIKEVLNMDIKNFEDAYYFYIGAKAYLNLQK